MNRVFPISYQATIILSIVLFIQNTSCAMNMCEMLFEGIRECNSATVNEDFLQCLLRKVTGMSDMTIFQLSTQNCYPSTTQLRARVDRLQQTGTVTRRKNLDCSSNRGVGHLAPVISGKQHNYESVRAGRETIHVKYHSEPQTWDEALKICHSEGAMLSMPNSKAKEDAMMAQVPFRIGQRTKDVWIGLRDLGKNDTFFWLDGSSLSYQHWHRGKPSHSAAGKDEDCVAVMSQFRLLGRRYVWNDLVCSQTRPFICQCLIFRDINP